MKEDSAQLVFLIGFMGAGKTTLGKAIGEVSAFSYLDLDDIIEEREGKKIRILFAEKGEAYFRQKEREALESLEGLGAGKYLVACGGGTPCYHDNMKWLNEHGLTLYLRPTVEEIVWRVLPEKDHRPMISAVPNDKLHAHISVLLTQRETYYLQAHHVLEGEQLSKEYILARIEGNSD